MSEEKALLVVSFGTSYEETLEKTIAACERHLAQGFPGYRLNRAFTSHFIIKKLKRTRNLSIETPAEALERLLAEGVRDVVIQPLHILPGEEYHRKILRGVRPFRDKFRSFALGRPLLYSLQDYEELLDALSDQFSFLEEGDALALMGHGSDHPANSSYSQLQAMAEDRGLPYHVGCVEGYPLLDRVVRRLRTSPPKRVHAAPLMLVAGDHACNDMAGEERESWKNRLEAEGWETRVHLVGLGENPLVREMFLRKAKQAWQEAAAGEKS